MQDEVSANLISNFMEDSVIKIWTDGASRSNPGPASWAVFSPTHHFSYVGMNERSTNNRMEMKAIINALLGAMSLYPDGCDIIEIYSDSSYSINTFRHWMWNWVRSGTVPDHKNPDLVEQYRLLHNLLKNDEWTIRLIHVKGHANDDNNIKADRMCNQILDHEIKEYRPTINAATLAFWISKIRHVNKVWYKPTSNHILIESISDFERGTLVTANILAELYSGFKVFRVSQNLKPADDGFIEL